MKNGTMYVIQWFLVDKEDFIYQSIELIELENLRKYIEKKGSSLLAAWQSLQQKVEAGDTLKANALALTGSRLIGQVKSVDADHLVITNEFGEFVLKLEDLIELETQSETDRQVQARLQYGFPNPSSTRYLFAPSAIPLRKGENYYQNVMLTVSSINLGVTDRFAVSAGTELISLLATVFIDGTFIIPAFVNFKYSGPVNDRLHLGGGAIMAGGIGDGDALGGVLAYGIGTVGDIEHNATFGMGLATAGVTGDENMGLRPVISLNGMTRVSKRVSLVSENWFFPSALVEGVNYIDDDQLLILSGGFRILTPDVSFDVSLLGIGISSPRREYDPSTGTYLYTGERRWDWVPLPIPFLGLVYRFGDY